MHPAWVINAVNHCRNVGVPVFFKQWGEYAPFCLGDPKETRAARVGTDGKFLVYPARGNAADLLVGGRDVYRNGTKANGNEMKDPFEPGPVGRAVKFEQWP